MYFFGCVVKSLIDFTSNKLSVCVVALMLTACGGGAQVVAETLWGLLALSHIQSQQKMS